MRKLWTPIHQINISSIRLSQPKTLWKIITPRKNLLILYLDTKDDKSSPGNSNYGRRDDPQIHKAVTARLKSPEMSLLDALIEGGFTFLDGTEGDAKSEQNVYDSENVLLCERKNQLNRRLCFAQKGVIIRFLSFYDGAKTGL